MSDQDVRKGYRALISGGAVGLGDEDIQNLSNALAQAQRDRGLTPDVDEISYLQEYLSICESHLSNAVSVGDFDPSSETTAKLEALNIKFPNISETVRKTGIIASDLDASLRDEGWMSSSYQC